MKNNRKGFTLIELLVVVLIIGILASIAIPQYFKVVEKARVAEATSLIAAIKSAEERYLARAGVYTDNFNSLDISYKGQTNSKITTKFFEAAVSGVSATGDPVYTLTVKRITTSGAVAGTFGAYSLKVVMPDYPGVVIAACPGGTGKCDALIN